MKSFTVLLLLAVAVSATVYLDHKPINADLFPLSFSEDLTFEFNVTETQTWDSKFDAVLYVKLTYGYMEDLKITVTSPTGEAKIYFEGLVKPNCTNCSNAEFYLTKFENQIDKDELSWACRNTGNQKCVSGYVKQEEAFSSVSPNVAGIWEVDFEFSGASTSGMLYDVELIITNDIDQDDVTNDEDICAHDYDPNQTDSNDDGTPDVCECTLHNHHVEGGYERQCLYLDHFALNDLFYQGKRVNPGDWWPVVVPPAQNPSFIPGDYSHKGDWLSCNCERVQVDA